MCFGKSTPSFRCDKKQHRIFRFSYSRNPISHIWKYLFIILYLAPPTIFVQIEIDIHTFAIAFVIRIPVHPVTSHREQKQKKTIQFFKFYLNCNDVDFMVYYITMTEIFFAENMCN